MTQLPQIRLAGIQVRASNSRTEVIGTCVARYFGEGIADQIPSRKAPGKTYSVYTDYESDHTGEYTYFIGEEVEEGVELPQELDELLIPAQTYEKLTTDPGPMPAIVIEAWQNVWADEELEARRVYHTDFELYDERAADPQTAVVDLYIGIRSTED